MAEQNVADQSVDILTRAGVKRLHGAVGDSPHPVVDAVRRNSAVDWIHVRHDDSPAVARACGAYGVRVEKGVEEHPCQIVR